MLEYLHTQPHVLVTLKAPGLDRAAPGPKNAACLDLAEQTGTHMYTYPQCQGEAAHKVLPHSTEWL